jgi:hypothetical protein
VSGLGVQGQFDWSVFCVNGLARRLEWVKNELEWMTVAVMTCRSEKKTGKLLTAYGWFPVVLEGLEKERDKQGKQ